MPLYEYAHKGDTDCKHTEDLLIKMSEETPETIECSECGEDLHKILFSKNNFILKGSGWYKDHYGLKGNR